MFGDPVRNPMGWLRIKFDKLLTSIDSGWSPRCETRAAEEDEWGVLKLGAVTTCRYIESKNKALPVNLQPKELLEVKPGDLLFSRKNTAQLVAACALVMTTPPKLMLSDLIFRFRLAPNAPICPEYLWALLTHQGKRREIQSLATGAAGSMPNISKKKLREIPIELPPYEMQTKFVEAFAKCEHLRQLQAHKAHKQDNLFNSLQQRAFRGELTAE
jgi:type I restriction enzyme S subunit